MSSSQFVAPKRVKSLCVPSPSNPSCAKQQAQMQALTMTAANAHASTKYDPPPTPPTNPSKFIESFCSPQNMSWSTLFVVGGVCVVYGIVNK